MLDGTGNGRQGLERRKEKVPRAFLELLASADIHINGERPWDIQVHDVAFYDHVLVRGSLGFGEAYMDGLWDAQALDQVSQRLLAAKIDKRGTHWRKLRLLAERLRRGLFNLQSSRRAFQVGERHYDVGNDLFEAMLDSGMNYSCGYWEQAADLEQAQRHKLDLICRKLRLKPGERLLDIGCGWGGLLRHAARHYGVEAVGVTVSREQQALARERCAGLPVEVELKDYRELEGRFDKVVSVGMFEHVGEKNYHAYFRTVSRLLEDRGLFLMQTIAHYKRIPEPDPWIDKYIFPNGRVPSARELSEAVEGCFLIEDWHNFGRDYDRTLMAWWENFEEAWPRLEPRYGPRFYRMWKYYLLSSAGFFRSRRGQLWQLVLSKRSYPGTYRSVRL